MRGTAFFSRSEEVWFLAYDRPLGSYWFINSPVRLWLVICRLPRRCWCEFTRSLRDSLFVSNTSVLVEAETTIPWGYLREMATQSAAADPAPVLQRITSRWRTLYRGQGVRRRGGSGISKQGRVATESSVSRPGPILSGM